MRLCAVLDVMRRLLQPKNIMVSAHARTKEYDKSKYISILNIIQVQPSLTLWPPHVNNAPSNLGPLQGFKWQNMNMM